MNDLLTFIDRSPSPFHAVDNLSLGKQLLAAGPRREILCHPQRLRSFGLPDSPGGFYRLSLLRQPQRRPHLPGKGKRGDGRP